MSRYAQLLMMMGTVLLSTACLTLPLSAQHKTGQMRTALPIEEVCTLPLGTENAYFYRPARRQPAGTSKQATAVINVTYVDDFESWPQAAIDAFEYAKGLWEQTITSAQPIAVEARWSDLGGCSGDAFTLGSAGATTIHANFTGAPKSDTWYPVALANHLSNTDLNGSTEEILARFNAECDDAGTDRWYFGTDANPPGNQADFVSVVLHELGHGLGFTGAGTVHEGDPGTDTDDIGTVHGSFDLPYVYDTFTENGSGTLLNNYPDSSNALALALEGEDGGVFFDGTAANAANGGAAVPLYAPAEWDPGSSYAHLDETTYNMTDQALMTPTLSPAEAIHRIGEVTCGLFSDMGWTIDAADCDVVLPVEFLAFEALAEGTTVALRWQTAGETNNAGFDVEHRYFDEAFRTIGFVDGAGTTAAPQTYSFRLEALPPGRHTFRLKQIDFDGAFTYSPTVEISVALPGRYLLSEAYPNPFNPATHFTLQLGTRETVRIDVYDALGRKVASLHEGTLAAETPHRFSFEAAAHPGGLYILRVTGETFRASRTALLVK